MPKPKLVGIFFAGEPQGVKKAKAIPGKGLGGDRYADLITEGLDLEGLEGKVIRIALVSMRVTGPRESVRPSILLKGSGIPKPGFEEALAAADGVPVEILTQGELWVGDEISFV